ncbi:hypothetical protein CB1_000345020 [Camelus ferus]|nr:hypothetical protein CB1_000345020 [Camelus ferus]
MWKVPEILDPSTDCSCCLGGPPPEEPGLRTRIRGRKSSEAHCGQRKAAGPTVRPHRRPGASARRIPGLRLETAQTCCDVTYLKRMTVTAGGALARPAGASGLGGTRCEQLPIRSARGEGLRLPATDNGPRGRPHRGEGFYFNVLMITL